MPRVPVDYSKTVVYSITAPDGKVFVGHTTNLTQRKAHLKLLSSNLDSSDEESKFIKASGGFLAVKIAPVKSVDAKSAIEAKIASEEVRKELVKASSPEPAPRKYKRVPVPKVQELVPTPEPEPFKLMKPEVVLTVPVPVVIKKYPKFKETVPPERKTDAEFKDVHKRKSKPAPAPVPEPPAPPAPVPIPEPVNVVFPLPPVPEPVKRGRPRKVPIAE